MAEKRVISILYPNKDNLVFTPISDISCHDLGLDFICEKLSAKPNERIMLMSVMRNMSADPDTAAFRIEVFEDILGLPKMRERMVELLEQVQFLKDYGSFKKEYDVKAGLWEFLHRLNELGDYIKSVEAIRDCLSEYDVKSRGLNGLRAYVNSVYEDSHFAELKKDIEELKADTSNLKSVTVGINLNPSFEVDSIGLVSVNNKEFKSSGIIGNFAEALMTKEGIKNGNEWKNDYRFHPVSNSSSDLMQTIGRAGILTGVMKNPLLMPTVGSTIAKVPEKDSTGYVTHYFDREVSQMLSHITKKLGKLLGKYVSLSINNISNLIPEFMYYIRWAEYIEKLREGGLKFCKAEVLYQQDEKPDNSEKNAAIPDTGSKEPSHYQADISNQNVVIQDTGSKEPSHYQADISNQNVAIPDTGSKEPSVYQADISNQNVVSQDSGSKEPSHYQADISNQNVVSQDTGSKEPSHYQADISNQNVVSQDFGSKEPSPWGEGGSRSEPDEGVENAGIKMRARGIYNLKLAAAFLEEKFEIVPNDIDFDSEKTLYLLTGANRGGKTTITQAVGLLYVLAQSGIYVPGESFSFVPVDCIYTHYPADEDKTMDLGRLGEECRRFKDIFSAATKDSLLLLNETFSTTSFEEGYYIARDSVKAILAKGIRTIYNTHMHKLALEIDKLNENAMDAKAASLVVESEGGKRSFKVSVRKPEGRSYAEDIAVKYGVTYEQLMG